MPLTGLSIKGDQFLDAHGRTVLLRGVNLGGDSKVPYPNGGTNHPSDFSDHRDVSFIGRPFPLSEMHEHFSRLEAWGFNCVRLVTTWEAVEHSGPGLYDEAYLDYFAEIARCAGDYGLYVVIDFHQDAWSRMSGGDGAPGWTFEAVGLDFTAFHAAGAAHVMQAAYDYARGGRQEDRYPTMIWTHNYRMPANAIMWTLFFAGELFTPDFRIDGRSAQSYLQEHFLGAVRQVAQRVARLPHVLGFDPLNEPNTGWSGQALSYAHVETSAAHPEPVWPGLAWSPLDGLLVARGQTRHLPDMSFDPARMAVVSRGTTIVNQGRVPIWRSGASCPFEAAGAYRLRGDVPEVVREEFFRHVGGRRIDPEQDVLRPFLRRVTESVRAIKPEWMIFAELDPFRGLMGASFPPGMPERTVNASHWYCLVTLMTKTFMYPVGIDPFTGNALHGDEDIEAYYAAQLARIKRASQSLPGGAPTLIGEFGIPFDLDQGAAYEAWAKGDRSAAPWAKHVTALGLMYNALDRHLLSSAQWNYAASNRNAAACGDGWNQEDLSVFSRDQAEDARGIDSGGRAVEGFVRPYVRACQGVLTSMTFDRATGDLRFAFDADPAIAAPTEVYLPAAQYPAGLALDAPGLRVQMPRSGSMALLHATAPGRYAVVVRRAS